MPLFLRPALPQDDAFVYQLFWQVIHDNLYAWSWDPNVRQTLLHLQVQSKRGAYAAAYPNADYAIMVLDDQPVGHMIIDRSGEFYHLVDIAIVPQQRGAGIGTRMILALCMEAEMMHKNVRLSVSSGNPRAADLYRRLGFRVIQDHETDLLMERAPGDQAKVIAAP
jgi:ribosomal protein S18 acetylase RimI-like enzyme